MIITADWHMDKVSDSIMIDGVPSQILDMRTRYRELIEFSLAYHKVIVIAGDIFNKVNPSTQILGEFFNFLAECYAAGVTVYVIPGNHDCGTEWANLGMLLGLSTPYGGASALRNVVVVTDMKVFDIHGIKVLFVPHMPLAVQAKYIELYGSIETAMQEFGDFDMVVGHAMIRGVDYSNDLFFEAGNAMEFHGPALPNRLIVLGHIHKQLVTSTSKRAIVYPGSPRITNFGEVDEEKGYVAVNTVKDWAVHSFHSVVTPYVDLTIDLVNKDVVDLSPERIAAVASGAVIKVRVHARDRIQVDEPAIRRALNAVGHVTRFETIIGSKVLETKSVLPDKKLTHAQHLEAYLKKYKAPAVVKRRAYELGCEIIQGVLDAQ